MKLFQNIMKKGKTRKFILGVIIFLITFVICIFVFRNWDAMKSFIFNS
jgi:hypothetical protein